MSLRSKRRLRIAGSVLAALAIAIGLTFAYAGRSVSDKMAGMDTSPVLTVAIRKLQLLGRGRTH